jgi:hypothetical protein
MGKLLHFTMDIFYSICSCRRQQHKLSGHFPQSRLRGGIEKSKQSYDNNNDDVDTA